MKLSTPRKRAGRRGGRHRRQVPVALVLAGALKLVVLILEWRLATRSGSHALFNDAAHAASDTVLLLLAGLAYRQRGFDRAVGVAIGLAVVITGGTLIQQSLMRAGPAARDLLAVALVACLAVVLHCVSGWLMSRADQGARHTTRALVFDSLGDAGISAGVAATALAMALGAPPLLDRITAVAIGVAVMFLGGRSCLTAALPRVERGADVRES